MSSITHSSSFTDQIDHYLERALRKATSLEKTFNKDLSYVAKEIRNNNKRPDYMKKLDLKATQLYLKTSVTAYQFEIEELLNRNEKIVGKINTKIDIDDAKTVASTADKSNNLLTMMLNFHNALTKSFVSHKNTVSILEDRIDTMLSHCPAD